jgi:hypothetical protein
MRIAPLGLRHRYQEKLVSLTRSSTVTGGPARARIVLLAATVCRTPKSLRALGFRAPTAIAWRAHYEESETGGLIDRARSGRPGSLDHGEIATATLTPPRN